MKIRTLLCTTAVAFLPLTAGAGAAYGDHPGGGDEQNPLDAVICSVNQEHEGCATESAPAEPAPAEPAPAEPAPAEPAPARAH